MEYLVVFTLEVKGFEDLVLSEEMAWFIGYLIGNRAYGRALELARKVVRLKEEAHGRLDLRTIKVFHLLPFLLNQLKKHEEASLTADEAI